MLSDHKILNASLSSADKACDSRSSQRPFDPFRYGSLRLVCLSLDLLHERLQALQAALQALQGPRALIAGAASAFAAALPSASPPSTSA